MWSWSTIIEALKWKGFVWLAIVLAVLLNEVLPLSVAAPIQGAPAPVRVGIAVGACGALVALIAWAHSRDWFNLLSVYLLAPLGLAALVMASWDGSANEKRAAGLLLALGALLVAAWRFNHNREQAIAMAAASVPLVAVAVSAPGRTWPIALIVLAATGFGVVVWHAQVPHEDATDRSWLRCTSLVHPRLGYVAAVVLAIAGALILARGELLDWGGGQWAGTFIKAALLLYLVALIVWSSRDWYAEPSTVQGLWGRIVLIGIAVALTMLFASKVGTIQLHGRALHAGEWLGLYSDGQPTVRWALVWIPLPLFLAQFAFIWIVRLMRRPAVAATTSWAAAAVVWSTARLPMVDKPRVPFSGVLERVGVDVGHERREVWKMYVTAGSVLVAVLSAACVLMGSALVLSERQLEEDLALAQPGEPVMPPFTAPDDLALYYSPVLRLHPNEQWREEGVDEFFSRRPGLVASSHQCPLPTRWRTLVADGAGMPCGALALSDPDTPVPVKNMPHVFVGGTVYPILRKVSPITGSPVADNTHWVIEYWLFYPFDRWAVPHSAFGSLRQSHEGDWEVVVVGLDARYSPLFVAYSAHCGGVWRPWDTAPVVSLPEDTPPPLVTLTSPRPRAWTVTVGPDGHHPLVVVARGSHANYASTGSREPDWGSCELGPRASNALRLASFAGSVTEQTPRFGVIQVPAVARSRVAQRIARLPWWWGPGEEITLSGLLISSSHHGPGSPSFAQEHRVWDDPLGVIFGGGHWAEDHA
jgi:hypothetical protein